MIAGPGAGKGQPVGAHVILAQDIAGDIQGWLAFAGEIVEAKLPSLRLIARGRLGHGKIF